MKNTKSPGGSIRLFYAFILLIFLGWVLGRFVKLERPTIQSFFEGIPLLYAAVLFILLYAVLSFFLWFTKDIFMVASVVIYGPFVSTVFVWSAEIVNAIILFFLARRLGHGFVKTRIEPRWHGLWKRMNKIGFWDMLALRAIIFAPFRFLDLAFGLTEIPLRNYLAAVIPGSLPRVWMRQYFLYIFFVIVAKDLGSMIVYIQERQYLSYFALFYVILWVILFYRLKKILWG
jgi:uncharacterized membrane protein YdjX (TVP38/TMEM64 family)